jgi:hypothetical protein
MIEEVAEPSIRVYLSQEKKLKFKTVCVSQGRDMSDVVNELIDQWLEENANPTPATSDSTKSDGKGKGSKGGDRK